MRLLGLDVGDRRIGLALSDESATLAGGLPTLERVGPRQDLRALRELVRRHAVAEVVIGLPRRLDGTLGPQAEKVLAFAEQLRRVLGVPLVDWDERFTTAQAEQILREGGASRKKRKDVVDQLAAVLILQSYLDARKLSTPASGSPA